MNENVLRLSFKYRCVYRAATGDIFRHGLIHSENQQLITKLFQCLNDCEVCNCDLLIMYKTSETKCCYQYYENVALQLDFPCYKSCILSFISFCSFPFSCSVLASEVTVICVHNATDGMQHERQISSRLKAEFHYAS